GAIMAVPAGDQRDFEFSRKYNLPFQQIKLTADGREIPADELVEPDESWTVTVNTGQWSGLSSEEANRLMTEYAEANGFGKGAITYKLRDWGISRQRYWGTPVPMIHCERDGIVPVPDDQLPVVLPKGVNLKVEGGSPLDHVPEYVNVTCPKCGGPARRDTDTMDTFVDSSWYFFRYCDPKNDNAPFDAEKIHYWLPVDQYIGGIEHAVLHLIYTRYWTKVMRDMGLVKLDEPVKRLLTQGMINKETYRCPEHEWLFPEEVTEDKTCKFCGKPVETGRIEKMSKSKKNAVDPIELTEIHGADSLRVFVLFAGPPEKDKEWSDSGFEGASRYLQRVWRIAYKWQSRIAGQSAVPVEQSELSDYQRRLRRRTHQIVRAITENFEERLHLNTCISSLMELTNEIYAFDQAVEKNGSISESDIQVARESFDALIPMLAPFAPHVSEELWESFGHAESLANPCWPEFDVELTREEEIEVAVQVNGKLRSRIFASPEASNDDLRSAALSDEKVMVAMAGKDAAKIIVIPRKLVNIVVK
ncbi:MAG TPA: leucine--tRNA ligase, partial [Blastocatellia bacterium]|nr:leucine--tRNA ligase [Blastocatellia bacterium]